MILDASTALAAVLPDADSDFARAAVALSLDEGLVVPAIWIYEVQNGLAMALRRNRIDLASAAEALGVLRTLKADFKTPRGHGREFELARTYALTVYDAAYLAVAVATGMMLATNDQRLRGAAETLGIPLFSVVG